MPKRNRSRNLTEMVKEIEMLAYEKKRRVERKKLDIQQQFNQFYEKEAETFKCAASGQFIDDIIRHFSNKETEKEVAMALEGLKEYEDEAKERSTKMCEDISEFCKSERHIRRYTYKKIKKRLRSAEENENLIKPNWIDESFTLEHHFWFQKELTYEEIHGKLIIPRKNASELIEKSPQNSLLYQSFFGKKIKTMVSVDLHTYWEETIGLITEVENGDWQLTWAGIRHLFEEDPIVKLEFRWDKPYNLIISIKSINSKI